VPTGRQLSKLCTEPERPKTTPRNDRAEVMHRNKTTSKGDFGFKTVNTSTIGYLLATAGLLVIHRSRETECKSELTTGIFNK